MTLKKELIFIKSPEKENNLIAAHQVMISGEYPQKLVLENCVLELEYISKMGSAMYVVKEALEKEVFTHYDL